MSLLITIADQYLCVRGVRVIHLPPNYTTIESQTDTSVIVNKVCFDIETMKKIYRNLEKI